MCQERIQNEALKAGAKTAKWNSETKALRITYNQKNTSLKAIRQAIADAGHDNGQFKAPDKVYDNLPKCCKYRQKKTSDIIHSLRGKVIDLEGNSIPGAIINWAGTTHSVTTDKDGLFTIKRKEKHVLLVNSKGYDQDTIDIGNGRGFLTITMGDSYVLKDIDVVYKHEGTDLSFAEPVKSQTISEGELRRAACCNLSQSFETNPSVETSFTDAVTGTKQIEMLGLSGKYVKITNENIPDIRGLEINEGLSLIPGTWIENIRLSKGAGSVVNGYEGITGQMNLELKKPEQGEKLLANAYLNAAGVFELNFNGRQAIKKNWHTGLLLHLRKSSFVMDKNKDSFADMPTGNTFLASNRWYHKGKNGWRQNFGFKLVYKDAEAGQSDIDKSLNPWRMSSNIKAYKSFAKIGKVFNRPETSLGFQISGNLYEQDETYGKREYTAEQKSLYINSIFQSYIGNTMHRYKAGFSFRHDYFEETAASVNYDHEENTFGAFFEYTLIPSAKFSLVAGVRADYHDAYKLFFTPRLHAKYQPDKHTSFRISAGKAYRTSNLISEYKNILASSKTFIIDEYNADLPYGLQQEEAWNFGFNFSQKFNLFNKISTISLDIYHTDFIERVIADYEIEPNKVHFHNLKGDSRANSFQIQWDYNFVKNLELRLAYRFHDIQTTYDNKLQQDPFVSKHRIFANFYFSTESGWGINMTAGWQSSKKMPDTSLNPEQYRRKRNSPDYFIGNVQFSKTWNNRWDLYCGIENVLNYKQDKPIIAADSPWSQYFDATQIWGPIRGIEYYIGMRFRISQ